MDRSSSKKIPLEKLLELIEPTKKLVCEKIISDHSETIRMIPGSSTKHQAWSGGYWSHVEESMNIGLQLYTSLNNLRELKFDLGTLLFCIFIHDYDKLKRYTITSENGVRFGSNDPKYIEIMADELSAKYGYKLDAEELNAVKYAHGEGDDYHPTERIMNPLATFVHCSDIISARVWFDEGHDSDNW